MEEQKQIHSDEHHAHPESQVTVEHVDRMAVDKGSQWSIPLAIVIAGGLVGAALYFGGGKGTPSSGGPDGPAPTPPSPNAPSTAPAAPIDVELGSLPFLGKADASVEVVEFADFQCPFCGRFHETVTPQLKKEYIDTGKVKFAYRDFAFLGQESLWAANAARCANEQGKFWEYHDLLFERQEGENQGAFSKENLKGFARELGLDTAKFNACVDSGKYEDAVTQDVTVGQQYGVSGTPSTFINGRMISGAQPYAEFKKVIEEELNK
ncbi:MAG: hypothetical protein A2806_02580 [Candidatus Terrybacteria bacterium RIFCSPHIGHO2_01_FULL_48_17]|uniref:Thioredoxin domain-containing protein n=1 Tax=Candidatus Terrybacteria bacterium RIFCSPHIGHO2_01_FULL_48_17 TaxID=1802362 RepID=A0A1G2PHW4_9BACT|nr:MAG: hypothetical protein A2806_02580 [Candidatus Terrybacteria bacterium RIFCSPHIGHO2_01_FULL_48_17]